ncbi:hypothetical protein F511_17185 [Dorcoceras hygrometricum]|uniref:CCHC-type domain-containing protein n=1 Tax=Dorcoceras hygrometricum TaxID=472368 RepID=A0A2Z7CV33_9LAMI|nr:hypothetical protein F511_17185 [Dorcoceras hygrometricum]
MFTNDTLLIMNKNDEDLDLALALGPANRVQTGSGNVSGAGVNAKLKVDLAFAASDPLSELVWSPHKGLSLKCADSNLPDKKPLLLWNVGPTGKVSSPSQSIVSWGAGPKVATDGGILSLSSPIPNLENKLGEKTDDVVEERARISTCIHLEDSCKKNKSMEEDVAYNARGNNITELEVASCSRPNVSKLSKNSDIQSPMGPCGKETSASGGSRQNNADILCPKLEASAENELSNQIVKEVQSFGLTSPPKNEVCLYQEKGKEKALSSGEANSLRLANGDDDGSNESVESCNSVGFLSRGIKRQSYDQDSIHSNQRLKKQGRHGSLSIKKPHSSFINWISNMVKGFSDSCKEESSTPGLTLSCLNDVQAKDDRETSVCIKTSGSPNLGMGFQTMFQSLYSQDIKAPDTVVQVENYSIQESEELVVAENTSTKHLPRSFHSGDENTCKQIVVSNVQENPSISRNIVGQPSQPWIISADMACTKLAENKAAGDFLTCDGTAENVAPNSPLAMINLPGKSSYLTSLWITRFSTKTPQLGKGKQTNQVAIECHSESLNVNSDSERNYVFSNDQKYSKSMVNSQEEHVYASSKEIQRLGSNLEVSSDGKCTHKLRPARPTPEYSGSSEAMASVFARRLDALKRIVPTKRNITRSSLCFFCGKNSHDLLECPEATETEIDDLLVKTSSYDMTQESKSLCIRCFQLDHWAISCPLGSASKHCQSESHVSGVNPKEIMITSHSDNEIIKEHRGQSFPFLSVVPSKNNDAPADILHAIRKLRLSRVDILRWMDSHVSFSHLNGFFLRLRLAKLESGLGGTGYCVACIIGDTREKHLLQA